VASNIAAKPNRKCMMNGSFEFVDGARDIDIDDTFGVS
jgi:hypothetical protein